MGKKISFLYLLATGTWLKKTRIFCTLYFMEQLHLMCYLFLSETQQSFNIIKYLINWSLKFLYLILLLIYLAFMKYICLLHPNALTCITSLCPHNHAFFFQKVLPIFQYKKIAINKVITANANYVLRKRVR